MERKDGSEFLYQESSGVKTVRRYLDGAHLPEGLDKFENSQSRDGEDIQGVKRFVGELKSQNQFDYVRRFLDKLLNNKNNFSVTERNVLTKEHALAVSRDHSLSISVRTRQALTILSSIAEGGILPPKRYKGEPDSFGQEVFGVAGGIFKRKWDHSGQIEDLNDSFRCYRAGYRGGVKTDNGYNAINLAFLFDILKTTGHNRESDRLGAKMIREEIIATLSHDANPKDRWLLLTLAEAELGLGNFEKALVWTQKANLNHAAPWEREATARQWVRLLEIQQWAAEIEGDGGEEQAALEKQDAKNVLGELLGGDPNSIESVLVGKVGLALSGGGFRASFYHLGVFARLAELDMLRHIDVLSCVSGGSMVGAAYYIALRKRHEIVTDDKLTKEDYCLLVEELIDQFVEGVDKDIRGKLKGIASLGLARLFWGHGLLSSKKAADLLERHFYRPIWDKPYTHPSAPGKQSSPAPEGTIYMHDLNLDPAGFESLFENDSFNPKNHNWMRRNNVPALVLNATTLNTGHSWQFTTTWMGEWPYELLRDVNSTQQLSQAWYNVDRGIQAPLGQAVAASAAVPGIFKPSVIKNLYNDSPTEGVTLPFDVRLVDGGAYDNQGTVNLVAQDCNIILVSDAAGQLPLENRALSGAIKRVFAPMRMHLYAGRLMNLFMERIRQSSISALKSRQNSKLLRGLMFIHMKMGLDAPKIELCDYEEPDPDIQQVSKFAKESDIRTEFQRALSELRTDLNKFKKEEYYGLMACGYSMTEIGVRENLVKKGDPVAMSKLVGSSVNANREWKFSEALEIMKQTDLDKDGLKWLKIIKRGRKIPLRSIVSLTISLIAPIILTVLGTIGVLYLLINIFNIRIPGL